MSIFRSYFKKNTTLISTNLTNNSQNPVTEISYGSLQQRLTRFIFDIDLQDLIDKINNGIIVPNTGMTHTLHMTNTISYAQQYLGKKSYSDTIERASSFDLELFNIDEDWDEGSGYDFIYGDIIYPDTVEQASNWEYRKTDIPWTVSGGSYQSGITAIIGMQRFEKGSESLDIDITDYINQRLTEMGVQGLTGTTEYTGSSYGLGIKFPDDLEELMTEFTQAVAFHAKNTNTWYEPYVETVVDDTITDDRNYFYLDKDNDLYLYVNIGGIEQNITVDNVNIYDYEDNLIDTLTGDSIINVSKGVYKISLNIDSETYPDAVLFRDEWNLVINGRASQHIGKFYLISQKKYYIFDQSNQIDFSNYFFYFWGISERENIVAGNVRKIKLTIKELYANQNNFLPLDIEYRLFTTAGSKYEIDVIPFTSVNRTSAGYEFNLDTSWLIPQDYKLQIRMKNGNYYEDKQTLSFTVVSNKISEI
jgi:hypothetical protein